MKNMTDIIEKDAIAIMENVMMDTMYHVPSDSSIKTCLITKECVKGESEPVYNA